MNKKVITQLSAAALVASSVMPACNVLAMENGNQPLVLEEKEATKDQLGQLQQAVVDAKADVDQKTKALADVQKAYDVCDLQVSALQKEYETKKAELQTLKQQLNKDIVETYEQKSAEVNQLKEALQTKTSEKEALEAKLEKLTQNLEQATQSLDLAQKKLATLQAQHAEKGYTKEALEQTEEAVAVAQIKVDASKERLKQAKHTNDVSTEKLEQAKIAFDQATVQKNETANQYKEAKVRVSDTKKVADDIKQALDALGNSDVLDNAQHAYDETKAAYDEANAVLTQKTVAISNAQRVYEQKKQAYKEANAKVDAAQATIDRAQQTLDQHVVELTQAQQRLTDITKQRDQVTTEKEALIAQANTKEATINDLKTKDLVALQTQKETAQQKVNADQQAVDAAQAAVNKGVEDKSVLGSKGFFEYVGATRAVEILTNAHQTHDGKPTTVIGDKDDATSLANMKASLAFMKECNDLRIAHGLPALKVTHELMAISQVQTNISKYTLGHSRVYNVGENLAWGYQDPFDGWYTEEKAVLDNIVNDNPTLQEMRKNGATDYELGGYIRQHDPNSYSEIGHYLNIINPEYTITGFSMSTKPVQYSNTTGQVFQFGGYDDAGVMSVSEYEALFNEYLASIDVSAAKEKLAKELADAKATLKTSQQALASINEQIQAKQAEIKTLEGEVTSLRAQVEAKANEETALNGDVVKANETVTTLTAQKDDFVKDVETAVAQKQALLDTKEVETTKQAMDAQEEVVTKAREEQQQAQVSLVEKQQLRDEKLETLNAIKDAMKQDQAQLQARFEQASKDYNDALKGEQRLKALLAEKETALIVATKDKETATKAKEEAQANVQTAKETLTKDEEALQQVTNQKESILQALQKEADLQNQIDEIVAGQKDWPKEIEDTQSLLVTKEQAIKDLTALIAEKEAMVEEYAQAKVVWENVLSGGMDTLESDVLSSIATKIEDYKALRAQLAENEVAYNDANEELATTKALLEQAKADLDQAKKNYGQAVDAYNDYFESLKPKPTPNPEVKPTPDTKPNKPSKPNNGQVDNKAPHTADQSHVGLFAILLAISGLAMVQSKRKKEANE